MICVYMDISILNRSLLAFFVSINIILKMT